MCRENNQLSAHRHRRPFTHLGWRRGWWCVCGGACWPLTPWSCSLSSSVSHLSREQEWKFWRFRPTSTCNYCLPHPIILLHKKLFHFPVLDTYAHTYCTWCIAHQFICSLCIVFFMFLYGISFLILFYTFYWIWCYFFWILFILWKMDILIFPIYIYLISIYCNVSTVCVGINFQ